MFFHQQRVIALQPHSEMRGEIWWRVQLAQRGCISRSKADSVLILEIWLKWQNSSFFLIIVHFKVFVSDFKDIRSSSFQYSVGTWSRNNIPRNIDWIRKKIWHRNNLPLPRQFSKNIVSFIDEKCSISKILDMKWYIFPKISG